MSIKELSKFEMGDMVVIYYIDEDTKRVGMTMVPSGMDEKITTNKEYRSGIDSLVQFKLVGDLYPGAYSGGTTMRNGESVQKLKYKNQKINTYQKYKEIVTTLEYDPDIELEHILLWYYGEKSFELMTRINNKSTKNITLEMISSFSIGNITPFIDGDAYNKLLLHRLRSKWSNEGRLETISLEDLQLEPSWAKATVNSERFGQVGSLPVKGFFPFAAIEDTTSHVLWGAQLAIASSWQMEVYRKDDGTNLSGGIADREFGHWMKQIGINESFTTPKAIVTVCHNGGIDKACQRLNEAGEKFVNEGPKAEQNLPILFNEYCTTWGNPSQENIMDIVKELKGKGFSYFCIDAGWFKPEGENWDSSMGDYNISKKLFPDGLKKAVDVIRSAGMKPGIWFEIETVGKDSKAYNMSEHLLKRDGYVLSTEGRRFWDMKDHWVQEYLNEKIIKFIRNYGFEYLKIDYNDTIGMGCDGSDSLGEGLRQNIEASKEFFHKVRNEVPEIIIENCASGGHRLEPSMMRLSSMASFSDAHECENIPIIAANLHRAILPRQSQIWAVIRKGDSIKRITYSLVNTFLGRMCLSGDVTELTVEQWNQIQAGIAFYKEIMPIIKSGFSCRFGPKVKSYGHPEGWQVMVRIGKNKEAFVVLHTFNGVLPEYIEIPLPEGCPNTIISCYSDTKVEVCIAKGTLIYKTSENMKALALHLQET